MVSLLWDWDEGRSLCVNQMCEGLVPGWGGCFIETQPNRIDLTLITCGDHTFSVKRWKNRDAGLTKQRCASRLKRTNSLHFAQQYLVIGPWKPVGKEESPPVTNENYVYSRFFYSTHVSFSHCSPAWFWLQWFWCILIFIDSNFIVIYFILISVILTALILMSLILISLILLIDFLIAEVYHSTSS